jgi:hypothetical protein
MWYLSGMETNTTNTIPACPNPNLYEFTFRVRDRRRKDGYRIVLTEQREFLDADTAKIYAEKCQQMEPRHIVEFHRFWVLKQNFMASQPGFPAHFWEAYNTPYCCSAASELYWTM